ncbi:UNVERIFIED_CONTAM: hypothetical protein FKN15_038227 [Acipenser sinensis]
MRPEFYVARILNHFNTVSEVEVNGQFESVCESVFSEMESQAVDALDLPMPGCFRMRSHSYVRAIEKGCSQDDECVSLRTASPPRTTTTVRTIQSSTGSYFKMSIYLSTYLSCDTTWHINSLAFHLWTQHKPTLRIEFESSFSQGLVLQLLPQCAAVPPSCKTVSIGNDLYCKSPHSSGDLRVQWASSDPTTKPASSFTPRNSRADVSALPASRGSAALQVSPFELNGHLVSRVTVLPPQPMGVPEAVCF